MVKLSSNNYFLLFLGIVVIMDSQAFKRQLSFKDALLNKYSLEEDDEELCFIHINGSPKHKGKRSLGFNKKSLMWAITGFFPDLLYGAKISKGIHHWLEQEAYSYNPLKGTV